MSADFGFFSLIVRGYGGFGEVVITCPDSTVVWPWCKIRVVENTSGASSDHRVVENYEQI